MKALNGSLKLISVASLAVLIAAIGCSDSNKGDDDSGAAGADSSAGKSSTAGSAGTTTEGGGDGQGGGESDAGSPSQAGTSSAQGGEGGAGGEASGGSPGLVLGHGGDNGAGGAAETGPTAAKFCNDLSYDDDDDKSTPNVDTTMVLTVGEGDDVVTFEAKTGECVPMSCKEVPTGENVLVQMFDADDTDNALDAGTIKIPTG